MDKSLKALQRRLERMELEHLRQHALELHERLEHAEEQLRRAEAASQRADEMSEYWRESYMQMQEALYDEDFATHRSIGLTKDGALLVVKHEGF